MSRRAIRHRITSLFATATAAAALTLSASSSLAQYSLVLAAPATSGNPIITAEAPVGEASRLFLVDRGGRIRILMLQSGQVLQTPFLEVAGVSTAGERGLLGLAFHPQYAQNGLFYVHFQDQSGATVIAEYRVSQSNPNLADPASRRIVLRFPRPASLHNGGWVGFGPDGFLYLSSGDGGGQDAQSRANFFGKVLCLNVSGDAYPADDQRNYSIPATNPFVGVPGAVPEVWAYGLRNPFRCSFDRSEGDLWIADVGGFTYEEINRQQASSAGGLNFGWPCREGNICNTQSCCNAPGFTAPLLALSRASGCAIIGGYVYRGSRIGSLRGSYIQSDYCSPNAWAINPATLQRVLLASVAMQAMGIGQDGRGEIYVCGTTGAYRLVSNQPAPDCDGDGRTDEQEIFEDGAPDLNRNGVPDSCDAPCPCDWNGDDGLESSDYFEFLEAFFAGAADFDGSGRTDSHDYFGFVNCFTTLCSE